MAAGDGYISITSIHVIGHADGMHYAAAMQTITLGPEPH